VKLSVVKTAAGCRRAWQRIDRRGTESVRDYDWAMIEVTADDTAADTTATRRPRVLSAGIATPAPCPTTAASSGAGTLARLVSWCVQVRVEDDFQTRKRSATSTKASHLLELCTLDVITWSPTRPGHRSRPRTHCTGTRDDPDEADSSPQQPRTLACTG